MNLLEELVKRNIIQRADIAKIKEEARESSVFVEDILVKRGISTETLLFVKGEYYNIPTRIVSETKIPFGVLKYIPEESALNYRFIPLGVKEGVLEVGLVEPDNIEARDALNFISSKINMPFKIFLISDDDFRRVIEEYKGITGEVGKALGELETEFITEAEGVEIGEAISEEENISGKDEKGGIKIIEEAPVTKIVATILRYAIEGGASDVHVEPQRDILKVRFRVDGIMNTSIVLPVKVHLAVVARIKILSGMKLDEKRKPQDGRFSAHIDERKVDFRVSTFPTYFGEKVVMRILDVDKGLKTIDKLGMTPKNLQMIRNAINRPYGMILLSGPTGSGKTTTLYAMLNELEKEKYNVLSLEDPIEYSIEGVSQSQIHSEIGYTFANGLRTTLRQDPDIIMVGEIRDGETAQLAIQAALTGHLVLSTIHTNNATGVIPRLLDMGIEKYLIAPTLIMAIAQRLTRTLCPGSGKKIPIKGSIEQMIEKQFSDLPQEFKKDIEIYDDIYEIDPSPSCPSGTQGRVAVYEMMEMDKEIEDVILKNPIESEIYKIARRKGMLTMKEDALIKSFKGQIPFEEVNKL